MIYRAARVEPSPQDSPASALAAAASAASAAVVAAAAIASSGPQCRDLMFWS